MAKIRLPDYACRPTFVMMYEGDPECDHDWEKVESDDYITWRCRKCPARAVEEARQRLDATVSL